LDLRCFASPAIGTGGQAGSQQRQGNARDGESRKTSAGFF